MANPNYEDKIIEAIERIVDNAVSKANYDKTIQCQIIECIDPTIGKYKVKYQDSSFIAYSGSLDVAYENGTDVYVLIPGNDMTREKTILGTSKKLGYSFSEDVTNNENVFEQVGSNCINSLHSYEFCSYRDESRIVYDRENGINEIDLNIDNVENYLTKSEYILCGGNFKTKLPIEQQIRGNFGVAFELTFQDNATGELINRNYVIGTNQMLGNPYKQTNWTRQFEIFPLDNKNFKYVNRIYLFVINFPHKADDKSADIFIKDLELIGMVEDDEEIKLSLITPNGTYFTSEDVDLSSKLIQAQIKIKGNLLDYSSQKVDFYWFTENMKVSADAADYCVYGGQGWKCENSRNLVGTDSNGNAAYEWVPARPYFEVLKRNALAKETIVKCVAVYGDLVLSKEVTIVNYDSQWDIAIESDSGTKFYYDIGNSTLTCKVNGEINEDNDLEYVWAEIDSSNNFNLLQDTIAENNEYNDAVAGYEQLETSIKEETSLAAASEKQLQDYLTTIRKYDKILRVERMFLHKLPVNRIVTVSTYKCSVFKSDNFIGTGSIVITNMLITDGTYSLVLNNGSKIFKYDETGIAPNQTILHTPIEIPALSFTLYDNLGRAVAADVIEKSDIKWLVPTIDTMIIPSEEYQPESIDEETGIATYGGHLLEFNYNIQKQYDIQKNNNDIQLVVQYKDTVLTAKTSLGFTKEGAEGSNGTDFLCKIVPNVANLNGLKVCPMIINGKPNFTPLDASKLFRIQLWHSADMIYESADSGLSSENKRVSLRWEVLANRYAGVTDNSDYSVSTSGNITYNSYSSNTPANILKCNVVYNNINYYATYPLISAEVAEGYSVGLIDGTGFQSVTYSADGRRPEYNSTNPFELLVTRIINGVEENVSTLTKDEKITYNWSTKGKLYNQVDKVWEEQNLLTIIDNDAVAANQKICEPADTYNGECVNVALECELSRSSEPVGKIHIPIHLLLNKYGHAALNDWDGNSVSVDKDGNGVILAPQIGAGKKEVDNSFSGLLMGEVKEANQKVADVGLLGYNQGQRTMYLSAYDGYAIFGKQGPGQIILDPTMDKAMLYSYNFWNKYYDDNLSTNRNGLPVTDYTYNETTHKYNGQKNQSTANMQNQNAGMLIDLTTPRILFGNGNLRVEPNGFLYAKGGGEIAGWKIDDYKIYKDKTGMSSVDNKDATGATIVDIKRASAEADWVNDSEVAAFWAGNYKFFVSHDGYLKVEEASIGSGTAPIFIGKNVSGDYSALYSGRKSTLDANADGFYIGTDGISLGTLNNNNEVKFQVTNEGVLTAREGTVGGWGITRNTIKSGNVTLNNNGNIDCTGGKGWYIHNDGTASFGGGNLTVNANGNVEVKGKVTATSGSIDGWTIESGRLYANGVSLRSGGSGTRNIEVNDGTFYVMNSGYVYARSGTIGGWTLSSSALTSQSTNIIIDGQGNKIRWVKGNAFFACGDEFEHPIASAINVSDRGIAIRKGLTTSEKGEYLGAFGEFTTPSTGISGIGLTANGANPVGLYSGGTTSQTATSYVICRGYVVTIGAVGSYTDSEIVIGNQTYARVTLAARILSWDPKAIYSENESIEMGRHYFAFTPQDVTKTHYAKFVNGLYTGVSTVEPTNWSRDN